MLMVYNNLLSSLTFWCLSLLVIIAALLPDYTMKVARSLNIRFGRLFPGVQNYDVGGLFGRRVQSTNL